MLPLLNHNHWLHFKPFGSFKNKRGSKAHLTTGGNLSAWLVFTSLCLHAFLWTAEEGEEGVCVRLEGRGVKKRNRNKDLCCEKWRNVHVRVVRAALDSRAERSVKRVMGGCGEGSLSQPLQGNWLQMWGSVAPAPARRQGRIKSSAQGWWDCRDWTSYCAADHWASTSSLPPSLPPFLSNPAQLCSTSWNVIRQRPISLLTLISVLT